MSSSHCRPFNLLDGMILVVAAGLSMWLVTITWEYAGPITCWNDRFVDDTEIPYLESVTESIRNASIPILLPPTVAILLIRLRGPRPSFRRLRRQPGFAATVVVGTLVAVYFAGHLIISINTMIERVARLWSGGEPVITPLAFHFEWFFHWYFVTLWFRAGQLGSAVAAAWIVLALGRSLRCEKGWIDRCGILLGSLWILSFLANCFSYEWLDY